MIKYLVIAQSFKPSYCRYAGTIFSTKTEAVEHAAQLNKRWIEWGFKYTVVTVEFAG